MQMVYSMPSLLTMLSFGTNRSMQYSRNSEVIVRATSQAFNSTNTTSLTVALEFKEVAVAPVVQFSPEDMTVEEDGSFVLSQILGEAKAGLTYVVAVTFVRTIIDEIAVHENQLRLGGGQEINYGSTGTMLQVIEAETVSFGTITSNFTVGMVPKISGHAVLNVSVFSLTSDVQMQSFIESVCFNNISTVGSYDWANCLSVAFKKSVEHSIAQLFVTVTPRAHAPEIDVTFVSIDVEESSPFTIVVVGLSLLDRDGSESAAVKLMCKDAVDIIDHVNVLIDESSSSGSRSVDAASSTVSYDLVAAISGVSIAHLSQMAPEQSDTTVMIVPSPFFSGSIECSLFATAVDRVDILVDTDEREIPIPVHILARSSGAILHASPEEIAGVEDDPIEVRGVSASLIDRDGSEILWLIVDLANVSSQVQSISLTEEYSAEANSTSYDAISGGRFVFAQFESLWALRGGLDMMDFVGSLKIQPIVGFSGLIRWTLTALSIEHSFVPNSIEPDAVGDQLRWLQANWHLANKTTLYMESTIRPICHHPIGEISPTSMVTKPLRSVPVNINVRTPDTDGSEVLSLFIVANSSAILSIETDGSDGYLVTEVDDGNGPHSDGLKTFRVSGNSTPSSITTKIYVVPAANFVGVFTTTFIVRNEELETGETKESLLIASILVVPADPVVYPTELIVADEGHFVHLPFARVDIDQEVATRDHLLLFVEGDRDIVSDVYAGIRRVEKLNFMGVGPVQAYSIPYQSHHALSLRTREHYAGVVRVYFVISTVPLVVAPSLQSAHAGLSDGIAASAASILIRPRVNEAEVVARFDTYTGLGHLPSLLVVETNNLEANSTFAVRGIAPKRSRLAMLISSRTTASSSPERINDREYAAFETRGLPLNVLYYKQREDAQPMALQLAITSWDAAEQQSHSHFINLRRDTVVEARSAVDVRFGDLLSRPLVITDDGFVNLRILHEFIGWSALTDVAMMQLIFTEGAVVDNLSIGDVVIPADRFIRDNSTGEVVVSVYERDAPTLYALSASGDIRVSPRQFMAQNFGMRLVIRSSIDETLDGATMSSKSLEAVTTTIVVQPTPNDPVLVVNTTSVTSAEELPFGISIVEGWTPDQDGSEVIEVSVIVDSSLLVLMSVNAEHQIQSEQRTLSPSNASFAEYVIVQRQSQVFQIGACDLAFMPLPDKNGNFTVDITVRSIELLTGDTKQISMSTAVHIAAMPIATIPSVEVSPAMLTGGENDILNVNMSVMALKTSLRYHIMVVYPSRFVGRVDIANVSPLCRQALSDNEKLICTWSISEVPGLAEIAANAEVTVALRFIPVAGMAGEYGVQFSVLSYTEDIQAEFFDPEKNDCFSLANSLADVLQCRSFRERKSLMGKEINLVATVAPRAVAPVLSVLPANVTVREGDSVDIVLEGIVLSDMDGSEELSIILECDAGAIELVSTGNGDSIEPLVTLREQVVRYNIVTVAAANASSFTQVPLTIQPMEHFSGRVTCTIIAKAVDRTNAMLVEDHTNAPFSMVFVPIATAPNLFVTSNSYTIQEDSELVTENMRATLVDRDGSESVYLVLQLDDADALGSNPVIDAVDWISDSGDLHDSIHWFSMERVAIVTPGRFGQDLAGALKLRPRVGFSGRVSWKVRALSLEQEALQVWSSDNESSRAIMNLVLTEDDNADSILRTTAELVATSVRYLTTLEVTPIAHRAHITAIPDSLTTSPLLGALLTVQTWSDDSDGSEQIELMIRVKASAVLEVRSVGVGGEVLTPDQVEGDMIYSFKPVQDVEEVFNLSRSISIVPREDFLGIFGIQIMVTTTETESMERQEAERLVTALVIPANPATKPVMLLHSRVGDIVRIPFDRLDLEEEVVSRDAVILHFERGSQFVSSVFTGFHQLNAFGADAAVGATTGDPAISYIVPYAMRHSIAVQLRADARAGFVSAYLILSTIRLDSALMSQLRQLQFNASGIAVATLSLIVHPRLPTDVMAKTLVKMVTDGSALSSQSAVAAITVEAGNAIATNTGPSAGRIASRFEWSARSPIESIYSNVPTQMYPTTYSNGSGYAMVLRSKDENIATTSVWYQLVLRKTVASRLMARMSLSVWDIALQKALTRFQDHVLDVFAGPVVPATIVQTWRLPTTFELPDDADLRLSLAQLLMTESLSDLIGVELMMPRGAVDFVADRKGKKLPLTVRNESDATYDSWWVSVSKSDDLRSALVVISPRRFVSQNFSLRICTSSGLQVTSGDSTSVSSGLLAQGFFVNVLPSANAPVILIAIPAVHGVEERDVAFSIDKVYTPDVDGSEALEVTIRLPVVAVQQVKVNDVLMWKAGASNDSVIASVEQVSNILSIVLLSRTSGEYQLVNQTVVLTLQDDYSGQFAVQVSGTSVEKVSATLPANKTTQNVGFVIDPMPRAVAPTIDVHALQAIVLENDSIVLQTAMTPISRDSLLYYKVMISFPASMVQNFSSMDNVFDFWSCRSGTENGTVVCSSSSILAPPGGASMQFTTMLSPVQRISGQTIANVVVYTYTADLLSGFFESKCALSAQRLTDMLLCRSYRERKSLVGVEQNVTLMIRPRAEAPRVVLSVQGQTPLTVEEDGVARFVATNVTLLDRDGSERIIVRFVCGKEDSSVLLERVEVLESGSSYTSSRSSGIEFTVANINSTAPQGSQITISLKPRQFASGFIQCQVIAEAVDVNPSLSSDVARDSFAVPLSVLVTPVATAPVLSAPVRSYQIVEDEWIRTSTIVASLVDRDMSEIVVLRVSILQPDVNAIDQIGWSPQTMSSVPATPNVWNVSEPGRLTLFVTDTKTLDLVGTLNVKPRVGFSGSVSWRIDAFSLELVQLSPSVISGLISSRVNFTEIESLASPRVTADFTAIVTPIAHIATVSVTPTSLMTKPLKATMITVDAFSVDQDGSEVVECEVRVNTSAVSEIRDGDTGSIIPPTNATLVMGSQATYLLRSGSYRLLRRLWITPRAEFVGIFSVSIVVTTTETESMEQKLSPTVSSTIMVVPLDPVVRPTSLLRTSLNDFVHVPFQRQDTTHELATRNYLYLFTPGTSFISDVYAGFTRIPPVSSSAGEVAGMAVYGIPYTLRSRILVRPVGSLLGYVPLYFVTSTVQFQFASNRSAYLAADDGIAVMDVSLIVQGERQAADVAPASFSTMSDKRYVLSNDRVSTYVQSVQRKMSTTSATFVTSGGLMLQYVVPQTHAISAVGFNSSMVSRSFTLNSTGRRYTMYQTVQPLERFNIALERLSRAGYAGSLVARMNVTTASYTRQRYASWWVDITQRVISRASSAPSYPWANQLISPNRTITVSDDQNITFTLAAMGFQAGLVDLNDLRIEFSTPAVDLVLMNQRVRTKTSASTSTNVTRASLIASNERIPLNQAVVTVFPRRFAAQTFTLSLRSIATTPVSDLDHASNSRAVVIDHFRVVVRPVPNTPQLQLNTSQLMTLEDLPASLLILDASTPDRDGSEAIEVLCVFSPASIIRQVQVNGTNAVITVMQNGTNSSGVVTILARDARAFQVSNTLVTFLPRDNFAGRITVELAVSTMEIATGETAVTKQVVAINVTSVADPPHLALAMSEWSVNQATMAELNISTLGLADDDGSETLSLLVRDMSSGMALERVETSDGVALQKLTDPVGGFLFSPVPPFPLRLRFILLTARHGRVLLNVTAISTEQETQEQAVTVQTATLNVLPIADAPLVAVESITRGRVSDWVRVGITNVTLPDPTKANATVIRVYIVLPGRTVEAATRELQVAWQSGELTAQIIPSVSNTSAVYIVPPESTLRDLAMRPVGMISSLAVEIIAVSTIVTSQTTQRTASPTSLSFAAILLSTTTFSLKEGAAGTFGVNLLSAPSAPITVSFSTSLASKAIAAPSSVVFTTADWNVTRLVQVEAVNNFLEDGDIAVTLIPVINTTDPVYSAVSTTQIAVQVLNDDTSGIVLFQRVQTTPPALVVAEGRVFSDSYSIVLTAEPTADVMVAITTTLAQLIVVPVALTFTAANWNVSQSVTIHADDNFVREGDHFGSVNQAITSTDRLYSAVGISTLQVKIVETKDTTPPPKLVSAKFMNTAVGLTVQFDRSVNRQNVLLVDNTFLCSVLFDLPAANSTTNYFGASPSCSWQSNDQAVRLVFGSGVNVIPGSSLMLKGGILKSTPDAELATASTSLAISLPDVVPQPVANINGATSLGTCDDLFLDGSSSTGSGGRTMVYTWFLNQTTAENTSAIVSILSLAADANRAQLTVPAANLEANATYSFVLQVLNFFGAQANSSTIFVKKAGLPLPVVSIQGGAKQEAFRARELSVIATADAPTCSAVGAAASSVSLDMTFTWMQVEGDLTAAQFKSNSTNPRNLRLPARTLTVGVKYVFQMVVSMAKMPAITNYAAVEVTVLPSGLTASIAGGDRSAGVEQDLTLDASKSQDPDDLVNAVPMVYSWNCLMRTTASGTFATPCTTATGELLMMNGSEKPVIAAYVLNPNIYYQFTVNIAKDTRTATSSVVIFYLPGSPPIVTIEALGVSKVNANDRVVLKGSVTSKLPIKRTEWSLLSGGGSAAASAALASTIFAVPTSGRRTMVLRENSLTPGVTYVFQFLAEDSGGSAATATIAVTANSPPTSGSLTVTPTSGYALDDTFTVQATNWVDEDLPLRYTYRYIKGAAFSGGAEITLGSASLDPLYKSIFPIGGGDNTTITLIAYVQDAFGAVTRVYKEITVQKYVVAAADQAAYLANKTDAVLASALSGDPSKVLNSISALGDLINGVDESTVVAPTPAPTTMRPGATPSPTTQVKMKSCPTSNFVACASNGECVREPANCPETNLACVTYCKCANGFYGDNCAMNQAQYDAKRTALGSLISAMVTSGKSIDVTDANAVEQQASSIATLTKSATILDAKAQSQALSFVDNLVSAPVLSGTAKTAVGSTVSNLLEIGSTPAKKTTTKNRRLAETGGTQTGRSDNSGSGGGFWSWVGSLSASGSSNTDTGTTATTKNGTSDTKSTANGTDPFAEEKARLAQLQGTIAKLENALLGGVIEGEPPTTLVTKNLKIVAARDTASSFEGTELSVPPSDAERAANYTPPSTTIPKGFGAFVKSAAAAARRRRRLKASATTADGGDTDEDPTVDIQSSLFTKNPYSFTGETVNSPVLSVKVRQAIDGVSEEVQVHGLETPFRIMMRNIEAVPPMANMSTNATKTAQVFYFHCVNNTKSTQFFNCSDVNEVVSVDCDGLGEYDGNVTCPTKQTTPVCRYWSTVNNSWSSDGCEAVGTTDDGLYTICECTHLTDFSTQVEQALSQVTTHFKKVISHKVTAEDVKKNIVLLLVMGGFFLLYVVAFFYVSRWDHRDRLLNLRQKRLSQHETKHVKLGSSPIFQAPEYMSAVGWRAKAHVVVRKFWDGLKNNHKLLSIAFKFDEHFTRTQRITVIFTVIMSQMFTNALLYRLRQGEKTVGSAFVAGVLSFLCMIPVTIAFVLMFKKAGRKQTYLVRYRVEDIEGNVAEVQTDAYGQPKQYSPFEMLSMDLAAIANCVEARSLQAVANRIKSQGIDSRAAQVCRGVFLAVYNRDFDEEPPEESEENDSSDPLKGVIVKIKAQLQEQVLHEGHPPARRSLIGGFAHKRKSEVVVGGSRTSSIQNALEENVSGPLAPIHEQTKSERRTLALNQLLLMLGQGGGDMMLSNMLKFDPIMVSATTADKIRAICIRYCNAIDEEAEDDDEDDEGDDYADDAVATTLLTLQDWLSKCKECCEVQESNAFAIAAKARVELERTESQLKKLQVAIGSQFEKRLSEIVAFSETVGVSATSQNAQMVNRTKASAQAARRATRLRARSSVAGAPNIPRNMDRRVTVAIKQQKNAILQANKEQLRERRKTVKEAQKILKQERKKIQKEAQKEMTKLVAGLRGVKKMKRKMELYLEAREKRRVDALPLHERQLYLVEQQRLKGIKRTSRLLYNQFLRRQPAKIAKPLFPEWVVYVSYLICFAWCVWCAFFVTMFAFEIGQVESQLWIGSLATGLAMTHVVSDPMKIFFRMGIMPLIATSVLADSGVFGAIDSSAFAIGAIAAVGTAGVAQLVARRKEEKAERRRLKKTKNKRLVPVADEEKEVRAEAMAIAGRVSDDEREEAKLSDDDGGHGPTRSKRGSFTNLWTVDLEQQKAEEYAHQRAAIEKELEEEEQKAAADAIPTLQESVGLELPKLVVTKGPPAQLARPPTAESPSKTGPTLAEQSTHVLKEKPSSVFGPSMSTRKPPPPVMPRGPLGPSLVSSPSQRRVAVAATSETPEDAVEPLSVEQCVCGERVRSGSDMVHHQAELCPHRLVECRVGCGLFIQARSRNGHELSQCRLVMCACGKMVLTQSLELHQQRECRNKLVACRLDCGLTMASHVRDRHERNDCPRRVVTCSHCGAIKHAADMVTHEAVECEVHKANLAVQAAMRASYAPPKLNQAAIRGPPRPVAMPGVVTGEGDDTNKLEALRERVRARRPPALDLQPAEPKTDTKHDELKAAPQIKPQDGEAKSPVVKLAMTSPMRGPPLAAVSPLASKPRQAIQPPAYPPPASISAAKSTTVDVSDMSPTRRKMVLGPRAAAVLAAGQTAEVESPRAAEVAAAAAVGTVRPAFGGPQVASPSMPTTSLASEGDVQDISNLVFESSDSDSDAKASSPSRRTSRRPAAEAKVTRNRSPSRKKYEM